MLVHTQIAADLQPWLKIYNGDAGHGMLQPRVSACERYYVRVQETRLLKASLSVRNEPPPSSESELQGRRIQPLLSSTRAIPDREVAPQ
jgi:hypothetical protein